MFKITLPLIFCIVGASATYSQCEPKDFGHGSVVCVCNETYCDRFLNEDDRPQNGSYFVYTSSMEGYRFLERKGNCDILTENDEIDGTLKIEILRNKTRQKILGFGGAFTDAAMLNIYQMPPLLQGKVFESYFSISGIEYTLGRIPMASCDFSTHVYSYDDSPDDMKLVNFSLAVEDIKLKIPGIKTAIAYAKRPLKLFGSPWAAPGWMKTNGKMEEPGKLKGHAGDQYHITWANYFIKFLRAYETMGVPRLWGLTVENEPSAGFLPGYSFQCMGFTAESERDFVKEDLGPALEANGYQNLSLMILDDQRFFLPTFADVVLNDPFAKQYVKGIGVHWYRDDISPASLLELTHQRHPDTFVLSTEACAGFRGPDQGVVLGSWERGEQYSHDILENLNHWVVGWVDWNLVLDMTGGPNWVKNFVDAPIIADHAQKVFYKQPTFYHLGHFSKFITPDSIYVESIVSGTTKLEFAAFLRPDKVLVLVVLNRTSHEESFTVTESLAGTIKAKIPARAIQTYMLGI